jgi:hypothetical protein
MVGIEDVLEKPLIPTLEMDERTSVIPQAWDANTPQVVMEPAENDQDVKIMVFEKDDTEVVLQAERAVIEPEQQAEEQAAPPIERPTRRDGQGLLIVRLRTRGSTPIVDTVAEREQLSSTAEIAETVHSAELGAHTGDGEPNVQAEELWRQTVQGTDRE